MNGTRVWDCVCLTCLTILQSCRKVCTMWTIGTSWKIVNASARPAVAFEETDWVCRVAGETPPNLATVSERTHRASLSLPDTHARLWKGPVKAHGRLIGCAWS